LPVPCRGECSRSTSHPWRLATSSPLGLALSLLFGAGQLILGGFVALRIARTGRWRVFGQYLLMLVALWFTFSGVCELLVSGAEAARAITTHPSAAAFATWRSQIDGALLVVSVILALALALYPLALRLRASSSALPHTTLDGKRTP
jgi:hypothetical protein